VTLRRGHPSTFVVEDRELLRPGCGLIWDAHAWGQYHVALANTAALVGTFPARTWSVTVEKKKKKKKIKTGHRTASDNTQSTGHDPSGTNVKGTVLVVARLSDVMPVAYKAKGRCGYDSAAEQTTSRGTLGG